MQEKTHNRYTFFIIALIIIIIFLFIYFSLNATWIKNMLFSLNLLPKPETFTELYFTNHLKLPSQVHSHTPLTFSFTIHNLEYKTINYPYEVFIDSNEQKQMIDKNMILLKNGAYKTITENFQIGNIATRSSVVVYLPNKKQQIDFWIEKTEQ